MLFETAALSKHKPNGYNVAKRKGCAMYSVEQIRDNVASAAARYNRTSDPRNRIKRVSLFGSFADGSATGSSDVDLLVSFQSPVVSLFTLARVLSDMEACLNVPVDVIQDPIPEGSFIEIKKVVPLYESA